MSLPIGFFTPLPLPIMIPFMFMQSAAMALAFGSNFQYGKRKISAMSNEDFNKMSALDMNIDLANTVNDMVPTVEQSFKQMEKMNITILDSMARYFAQAIEFGLDVLTGKKAIQGTESHFDVGHIGENLGSLLPRYTPEQIIGENAQIVEASSGGGTTGTRNFSYLKQITLGNLQTQSLKRKGTDIELERAIFKEIERRIAADPKILKPDRPLTDKELKELIDKNISKFSPTGSFVNNYASLYNTLIIVMKSYKKKPSAKQYNKFVKLGQKLNQLASLNRKPHLQIDTRKSLTLLRIVPKK